MTERTFEKYKNVVDEWLINGGNGTKAYQKIYPNSKDRSAEANFRKILAITRVAQYVADQQKKLSDSYEIEKNDIVKKFKQSLDLDPLLFLEKVTFKRTNKKTKKEEEVSYWRLKDIDQIPEHVRKLMDFKMVDGSLQWSMPSIKDSAQILNKMLGFNEAEKIDISGGYTYEIIPASEYVKRQKDSNTGQ